MKTTTLAFTLSFTLLAGACVAPSDTPPTRTFPSSPVATKTTALAPTVAGGTRLSGPISHGNLSVFLVHGADRDAGKRYLTLEEAMEAGKVVVHETGNVQELSIENVSGSDEVFVQSGDVVKGGQQDRVLRTDLVLAAGSGKVPIASYCVEQGRWGSRGDESAAEFDSSRKQVVGKALKLAAKRGGNQGEVWKEVSANQAALGRNLAFETKSVVSPTSLQLTLENEGLKQETDEYLGKLLPAVEGHDDVVGFAFAINGELNSAEVYASSSLFRKLWPKLLEASAVEAIASRGETTTATPPTAAQVEAALSASDMGEGTERELSSRVKLRSLESETQAVFETVDTETPGGWLHRSHHFH
ncbi:MAG: DUF6569 family protein [Acidobacteriota bacterium]